ncbi:putative membrane protein [Enhygromyxa salina]|uniref:Putative membrane protein n=1 Tax=Enhygromyxa salina TaxID=215803 RepID=A0A0C2DID0_9BACT|nr:AI-2E family transporter [Enhygromyxa salina]KIG19422.1 putative membrane protein [Enhygromyxa salina]
MSSTIPRTRAARVTFGLFLGASALLLAAVIWPIWKPLFLAAVLAAALSPANEWLARKLGDRRKLATTITTLLVVIMLMIPLTIIGVVIAGEAIDAYMFLRATLEQGGVSGLADGLFARLPDWMEQPIREVFVLIPQGADLGDHAMASGKVAANVLGSVLSQASSLTFDLVLTLIALHTLLLHGKRLVRWLEQISPLPETGELLTESRRVSGFALRSSFVTALLQGLVAMLGFAIASVPNPMFFGVLTFFTAFIPSVGTALVTFPMVGLLILSGSVWQPIFLAIWSLVAIGLIDNLVHPWLIRDGMHLNGVAIFFALVGGLLMFGGIGLIIGPLALAFFLAMIRFARRDLKTGVETAP